MDEANKALDRKRDGVEEDNSVNVVVEEYGEDEGVMVVKRTADGEPISKTEKLEVFHWKLFLINSGCYTRTKSSGRKDGSSKEKVGENWEED